MPTQRAHNLLRAAVFRPEWLRRSRSRSPPKLGKSQLSAASSSIKSCRGKQKQEIPRHTENIQWTTEKSFDERESPSLESTRGKLERKGRSSGVNLSFSIGKRSIKRVEDVIDVMDDRRFDLIRWNRVEVCRDKTAEPPVVNPTRYRKKNLIEPSKTRCNAKQLDLRGSEGPSTQGSSGSSGFPSSLQPDLLQPNLT